MICWQDAIPHLKQYCHNPKTIRQTGKRPNRGQAELHVGAIEMRRGLTRIHFVGKLLTKDSRIISSARSFELEGDSLRYEMEMHTTNLNLSTPHLEIALRRFK